MERINSTHLTVAIAAAFLTTVVGIPNARGELVYDNSPAGAVAAPAPAAAPAGAAVAAAPVAVAPAPAVATAPVAVAPAPVSSSSLSQQQANRVDDRAALREALDSSERARDTQQAEVAPAPVVAAAPAAAVAPAAPAPVVPVLASQPAAPAPAAVVGDSGEDVQNMSKAELLRRERMREELRNEDALEERLEELRLRDEQRRTQEILGNTSTTQQGVSPVPMPSPLYSGAVQEQAVVAPVTDHPGQPAAAPAMQPSPAPVQLAGTAAVDQVALGQSSMTASANPDQGKNKLQFVFSPQVGIGGGLGSDSGYYNVDPKFSTGFTLGVATSDYVTIEAGYTYSQYGVNMASSNPFISEMQAMQQAFNGGNLDTLTFNQNVVDAGLKVYVLGRDSMIRPFIGGGGAYSWGYINYNQQILNQLQAYGMGGMSPDYDVNQFLGYLSAGSDVQLTKNISVGAMFRYYAVLSSNESGSLNNYGFVNPGYAIASGSLDKQYAGGTVATSGFYNILANVSFSF